MKLTTRGRYAVTAMLDLSCHGVERPISLADISTRQEISLSYLEQLFAKLRRQGLVRSVRGPGGGYILGGEPEAITIADIIRAVDEPIQATSCATGSGQGCRPGSDKAKNTSRCITHHLWEKVGQHLNHYLESVHLGRLLEESRQVQPLHAQTGGLEGGTGQGTGHDLSGS
ncbi:MAG: Rrf2 family transcriptional regulator [Magnetococcales bacterium]|nr:Rrf2 family transcriptional regulator [Magnetococcales bacterium]